jgi:hypothetical protein
MKTMKILPRAAAVLALSVFLSLSACGSKEAEPTDVVEENIVTEVPVDESVPLNSAEATPAPAPLNVTNSVAPLPAFTDTEQMREDADATGLTARLPREDAPAAAANEAQPVN